MVLLLVQFHQNLKELGHFPVRAMAKLARNKELITTKGWTVAPTHQAGDGIQKRRNFPI